MVVLPLRRRGAPHRDAKSVVRASFATHGHLQGYGMQPNLTSWGGNVVFYENVYHLCAFGSAAWHVLLFLTRPACSTLPCHDFFYPPPRDTRPTPDVAYMVNK